MRRTTKWNDLFNLGKADYSIKSNKLSKNAWFSSFRTPVNDDHPFKRNQFFRYFVMEVGDFEPVFEPRSHFQYEELRSRVIAWTESRADNWQKIYDVLCEDYEPLWNYNRYDIAHDRRRHKNGSKRDTNSDTTTDVAGYNSGELVSQDELKTIAQENIHAGDKNRQKHYEHGYGNIGTMSTQDLVSQEVDLRRKYNMYDIIIEDFKDTFCSLVY